jgi:hypothetical protein
MPSPVTTALGRRALGQTTKRVPGLRRIPVMRLLALAEVAVIARAHLSKLEPAEWRRMIELIRVARGRPGNLSARQRRELSALVAKAEPRLLAGEAIDRLSPVSLPGRLLYGPNKTRKK